jgi:hypothetical protein
MKQIEAPQRDSERAQDNHSRPKKQTGILAYLTYPPRGLLFFLALLIQLVGAAAGGMDFVYHNSAPFMFGSAILWLVWLGSLLLIAIPATDRLLRSAIKWLKPAALTILAILLLVGIGEIAFLKSGWWGTESSPLLDALHRVFIYNDGTALCHQASQNLIEGQNPYAGANIVSAMLEFNGGFDKTTPLREGHLADVFPYPTPEQLEAVWQDAIKSPERVPPELESRMCYPAACFLLPAPFLLLGITDIRIVYLIFTLPALAYVVWLAPTKLRLPLAGALVASLAVWNSVASGETGILCFPFMLLGWVLARRHQLASAIFIGIAVAVKQLAWFLLPFYLIFILRAVGLKRALSAAGIVLGIFLASNAWFIAIDPNLWLTSLLAPMTDNLFPLGIGVVTLVTSGLVDIQSPLIFTVMEGTVFILAIIWYFRNCHRYPHTGPILAMLPLLFAWRSLWSYFFYIDIIVLAAVIIDEYRLLPAPSQLRINT